MRVGGFNQGKAREGEQCTPLRGAGRVFGGRGRCAYDFTPTHFTGSAPPLPASSPLLLFALHALPYFRGGLFAGCDQLSAASLTHHTSRQFEALSPQSLHEPCSSPPSPERAGQ